MENNNFAFKKENYYIMLAGLAVLFLGFFIMAAEPNEHGFGFMGLTLAPIVILLGFAIEFVAIFYKKKDNPSNNDTASNEQ